MLTAKEIMNSKVLTVRDDTSVIDVARFFHEKGIIGAPVVDDVGKMVGIVSQADLIKLTNLAVRAEEDEEKDAAKYDGTKRLKPTLLQRALVLFLIPLWRSQDARLERDEDESSELESRTAADIMTKNVVTVAEGEPIRRVVELMTTKGINRIPVVDGQGGLVGMITRADVVDALAKELEAGS